LDPAVIERSAATVPVFGIYATDQALHYVALLISAPLISALLIAVS
jgi:hypothetical protein